MSHSNKLLSLDATLTELCATVFDWARKHPDFALQVLRLLGEEVQAARRVQVGTPSLRRKLRHVEAGEMVGRTEGNEQKQKERIRMHL